MPFSRLKEGADSATDELDKDGVIQRFEFTFELLWKTLKLFLDDQGILTKSPKETIQEAFRFELLKMKKYSLICWRTETEHRIYIARQTQKKFITE